MLNTVLIILEQSMMHLPLMVGAYISFSLFKVPDLSIETAYVGGAMFSSLVLMHLTGIPFGIILAIVISTSVVGGAIVGITSTLLTRYGKFPHLLSSIITFGLFHGINQYVSPSYVSLTKLNNPLRLINVLPQFPELPIIVLIGLMILIAISYIFRTQLGYCFAVYGNNSLFFKNYGISTSFVFVTGITIANALAGISGYLFAQSNNFFELNMGLGKALLCITALILGKAIARTRKPCSVFIPIIGVIAYFSLQQLLLKIGFNLKYFTAMQALVVTILLLYTYRKQPLNDNLGV